MANQLRGITPCSDTIKIRKMSDIHPFSPESDEHVLLMAGLLAP
jgi:hypothetical protein